MAEAARGKKRAANRAGKRRGRSTVGVEAAGHGMWKWNIPSNRFVCSARFNEILGAKSRETTIDRDRWLESVHAEDLDAMNRALGECLEGRSPMLQVQARLRGAGGGWKSVLVCGVVVERGRDGSPEGMIGTITDVTVQRDALRQLAESEARSNAIVDSAMDAIITVDDEQRIIQFNAAAEAIFGQRTRDLLGQPLDQLIPQRFRQAHREHVAWFGATGVTMRRMGAQSVLYGLRKNGEEFPIDASISQVEVGGRKFFTVILRDVTARERATQQLHGLYAAMHEVREAERTRIARELHDELAQWLTALKMDVSWLKSRLAPEQAQLVAKTDKMREIVDTTVAAVRRIAADLRPPMLDDLGLVAAVENLLHEFSERAGIMVTLDLNAGGVEFRDPLATAIYRMIQEALTNVVRHAAASEVEMSVRMENGTLRVRVRDNGCGIGNVAASPKSFGVAGIRERARTLGGTAIIAGAPGGGTLVDIAIPVAGARGTGAGA
ncbi:MAG: PAS domain S-box protein [Betaproteobacteria bacterium]|nr:PAS domain S-box protein [Betaproteobacteria bacterium]